MKIKKILQNSGPVLFIAGGVATALGFFNLSYNHTKSGRFSVNISRTEAPFTARSFYQDKEGKEIASRYVFMDTREFYFDFKGKDNSQPDGLVDKISRQSVLNGPKGEWERERDYLGNEKRFAEADKYLAETKEKFKDLIKYKE